MFDNTVRKRSLISKHGGSRGIGRQNGSMFPGLDLADYFSWSVSSDHSAVRTAGQAMWLTVRNLESISINVGEFGAFIAHLVHYVHGKS